ncbi:MAG: hypothetical protein MHM6MM_002832 [Cercozoa sp. M6MM]
MLGRRFFSVTRPGRLEGKVAIVTGAASGIGRESALLFAKEGAKVVCADISPDATAKVCKEIKEDGFEALHFTVDVADEKQVEELVHFAVREFGSLDVMFNNAGIMDLSDGDTEATQDSTFDLTFDVNVKGVFYGCKYAIRAMKQREGGSIVNTGSFVGKLGAATPQLAYTASKGAVMAMTRELAVLHARDRIRVNSLCPGPLQTELLQKFLDTEEKRQRRLVHVPMGRFGLAKEQAQAALFLASDDASFVTGTDFFVDGGITAAYVTPE